MSELSPDMNRENPLAVSIAGVQFPSVILNASGAFNPALFSQMFSLKENLGGIVTKTVKPEHVVGNPQQRTVELPGIGMLNSIGLQGPGIDYFLDEEAPKLKEYGLPVILSIGAESEDALKGLAQKIENHRNGNWVDLIELNLSCPNVGSQNGGIDFAIDPKGVESAVSSVVSETSKPVFAKLTPNVTDIVSIGEAAINAGAKGLTAINTVLGAAINIKSKKPYLKRVSAGYSGPGIKPIAIHCIWKLHQRFPEIPIIGVGGISKAEDVLEFLMAGASIVQVGTYCFRHPNTFVEITNTLKIYAKNEQLQNLQALKGCAHNKEVLIK